MENASSRKSKSEDFISRFARIYTPAVCYAALALAGLWLALRFLLPWLLPFLLAFGLLLRCAGL